MIELDHLSKSFGSFQAVDDVTLVAPRGEILGLLGPNGAGKSTTISCLCGLLKPTAGQVRIGRQDITRTPKAAKARLGVVPQDLAIYEDLPARENLAYWGAAYGLRGSVLRDRIAEVLEITGLTDRASDKPRTYSGGMKRRLNFGCAILHRPDVLLLDEPTVGVDPQSRERLFDMVRDQTARGATVLYTTHHMEEAETLCDRIAVIDGGRKIAEGRIEELRQQVGERDILTLTGQFVPGIAEQITQADITVLQSDAHTLSLEVANGPARLTSVLDTLHGQGAVIRETTLRRPNLESLFLKLTGRELRA